MAFNEVICIDVFGGGGPGGHRLPWSSRLILIRAKKGGLLGQKSLFIVLDWVIRASFLIEAPLANASKYIYVPVRPAYLPQHSRLDYIGGTANRNQDLVALMS